MTGNTVEIWRPIASHPLYEVSNLGRVRSWNSRRKELPTMLSLNTKKSGHVAFVLQKDCSRLDYLVHRAVAIAFIGGPPSPTHEVNHINGDPGDNRVENLEWVTVSENALHSRRVLLRGAVGERHPSAKLNADKVRDIRRRIANREPFPSIARLYGVTDGCIHFIAVGRTWKCVR